MKLRRLCQGGWGWRQEADGDAGHLEEDGSNAEVETKAGRREHQEGATAGKGHILDEHMAKWLEVVLDWKDDKALLDVLRDEVTAVVELEAFAQPIESSGTWDPDQLTNRKTEEELLGELRRDPAAKCSSSVQAAIAELDTKNLTNEERWGST